jgi:L-methionine (R)-S-oxide reductase
MNQIGDVLAQLDELAKSGGRHADEAEMKPLADALAAALCAQSCAITLSSDSYATRAAPCPGTTALEVPIAIGAKRFGSIHICRSTTASGFDGDDLEYLGLIGWCIARTVESIRLQCTLGSHFAKFALAPAGGRSVEQIVAASAKHPDKTARLLARTFYRELARAGFTCNQIINAATEIISQLSIQLRQRKSSLGRVTNLSG